VDRKSGFTLIELLVVIAIIAILMGILMPTLHRAREVGKRANCMSNLKNLTLIWLMYADDHDGRLPSGGTTGAVSWIDHENNEEIKTREGQIMGIQRGVLWPYAKDLGLYRCPTATTNEAHTYIMPDSYAYQSHELGLCNTHGADPSMLIKKIDAIKRPAERMTYMDEGYASPMTWSIFYIESRWWDVIPIRHGIGTTVALADGHVEYWKWSDSRTIDFGRKANASGDIDQIWAASYWREVQPDNTDITRFVKAIWGRVGWKQ